MEFKLVRGVIEGKVAVNPFFDVLIRKNIRTPGQYKPVGDSFTVCAERERSETGLMEPKFQDTGKER